MKVPSLITYSRHQNARSQHQEKYKGIQAPSLVRTTGSSSLALAGLDEDIHEYLWVLNLLDG